VSDWPTVGDPLGQGEPSPVGPSYETSWQGQLERGDYVRSFYYVQVTNTIGIQALYRLCATQIESAESEPTGDSPANGLTSPPCSLEVVNGNTQIWHKVPYHAGKELELYLATVSPDISFDVFVADDIVDWPALAAPVGRGTSNPTEPDWASSWQGHLGNDDYYYVRVNNAAGISVEYHLCTIETDISGPVPTPTPGYPIPTSRPGPRPPRPNQ
jgi:hypothetical protein